MTMTITPRRIRQIIKEEILAEIEQMQPQMPEDVVLGQPQEPEMPKATLGQYNLLGQALVKACLKTTDTKEIHSAIAQFMKSQNIGLVEAGALEDSVKNAFEQTKHRLAEAEMTSRHAMGVMVRSRLITADK